MTVENSHEFDDLYDSLEDHSGVITELIFYAAHKISVFPANSRYTYKDATPIFEKMLPMWSENPDAAIEIATGRRTGLIAISVDVFMRILELQTRDFAGRRTPFAIWEIQTWTLINYSPDFDEREKYFEGQFSLWQRAKREGREVTANIIYAEMWQRYSEYGSTEHLLLFRVPQSETETLTSFEGVHADGSSVVVMGEIDCYADPFEDEHNPAKMLPECFFRFLERDAERLLEHFEDESVDDLFPEESPILHNADDIDLHQPTIQNDAEAELLGQRRRRGRKRLRKLLGLHEAIEAVIKRGSSNSTYELKLASGRIVVLGSAYELRQPTKIAAKLFEAGVNMPPLSGDKWREVLSWILEAEEEIETFTEAEEVLGYVRQYFSFDGWRTDFWQNHHSFDLSVNDKELLVEQLLPHRDRGFYDNKTGKAYLPLSSFLQFLNTHSGKRWTQRELTTLLSRHQFNYKQKTIRAKDSNGISKPVNIGRFWTSEVGYIKPD